MKEGRSNTMQLTIALHLSPTCMLNRCPAVAPSTSTWSSSIRPVRLKKAARFLEFLLFFLLHKGALLLFSLKSGASLHLPRGRTFLLLPQAPRQWVDYFKALTSNNNSIEQQSPQNCYIKIFKNLISALKRQCQENEEI